MSHISISADGFTVTLDKRILKTPKGKSLLIPREKRLVATLIANEWENQEKVLKPHALPMVSDTQSFGRLSVDLHKTSIASRAIDGLQEQTVREEVHTSLLKYFDTDTIWYVHLMNSCGLRSRSHAQLSSRQPISAS